VCSWLEEWRTIIGQLFSGEFNTANWNTFYHSLAWECYVLWEAAGGDLGAPPVVTPASEVSDGGELLDTRSYPCQDVASDPCVCAKFQGDDGVCCVPYNSPMSLARQRYYFAKYWDITIKKGPKTEENDYYFSSVDMMTGKIRREGVVFLQRRFIILVIKEIIHIMPFRPTKDYWGRLGRAIHIPPTNYSSPEEQLRLFAYYRMRWVGLLYDTMETNLAAAEQIRFVLHWLDVNHPQVEMYLQQVKDLPEFANLWWVQLLKDYALKLGPTDIRIDWARIPSKGKIWRDFVYDDYTISERKRKLTEPFHPQSFASRK